MLRPLDMNFMWSQFLYPDSELQNCLKYQYSAQAH